LRLIWSAVLTARRRRSVRFDVKQKRRPRLSWLSRLLSFAGLAGRGGDCRLAGRMREPGGSRSTGPVPLLVSPNQQRRRAPVGRLLLGSSARVASRVRASTARRGEHIPITRGATAPPYRTRYASAAPSNPSRPQRLVLPPRNPVAVLTLYRPRPCLLRDSGRLAERRAVTGVALGGAGVRHLGDRVLG
jgi:hypothetical protein